MAKTFDAVLYEDIKRVEQMRDEKRLVITPESLHKAYPGRSPSITLHDWDNVFMDECEACLLNWSNKITMAGRNKANLDRLLFLMSRAKTVILADADAGVATDELIFRLNKPAFRYTNQYRPEGKTLTYTSCITPLLSEIDTLIKGGVKLYVACSRKEEAKKIGDYLKTQQKSVPEGAGGVPSAGADKISSERLNVLTVHADSMKDRDVRETMANINNGMCHELDALIVSPAVASGVSIDNHSFDMTIGVFHNVLGVTASQAHQMICRARNINDVRVYIPKEGHGSAIEAIAKIEEKIRNKITDTVSVSGIDVETGERLYDEFLLRLDALSISEKHRSSNRFHQLFLAQAELEGYEVSAIPLNGKAEKHGEKVQRKMKPPANELLERMEAADIITDHSFPLWQPRVARSGCTENAVL